MLIGADNGEIVVLKRQSQLYTLNKLSHASIVVSTRQSLTSIPQQPATARHSRQYSAGS
jgi:hypothetical protein